MALRQYYVDIATENTGMTSVKYIQLLKPENRELKEAALFASNKDIKSMNVHYQRAVTNAVRPTTITEVCAHVSLVQQ